MQDIEIETDQDGHHYTYQGDDHAKRNLLFLECWATIAFLLIHLIKTDRKVS